jgi:hypothetical protein
MRRTITLHISPQQDGDFVSIAVSHYSPDDVYIGTTTTTYEFIEHRDDWEKMGDELYAIRLIEAATDRAYQRLLRAARAEWHDNHGEELDTST